MTLGHIHGRFQPFHNQHAEYLRWAATDCDKLIVGISNADPSHVRKEEMDANRHKPEHNPFKYFERYRMIDAYVEKSSIECSVEIMPFPINKPELWDSYVPESAVHYLDIVESWHEVKERRLQDAGREVRTRRRAKPLSATEIREKIRDNKKWRHHVPDPVSEVITAINGEDRVKELYRDRLLEAAD